MQKFTLIVPNGVGKLMSSITIPETAEILERYQAVEIIHRAIAEEIRRERRRGKHEQDLCEEERKHVTIEIKLDLDNQGIVRS